MLEMIKNGEVVVRKNRVPCIKARPSEGIRCRDIWFDINVPRSKEVYHYPTQKPIKLYERMIKASSNEGDTVLDPFCGSGTTLVAAKNLGRNFIGIDISSDAVKMSKHRLEEGK